MKTPYAGQLLCVPYANCPPNWAPCDGRTLAIADYPALYALVGTTYGGDGQQTFGLPDLRGRVPMGTSNNFSLAAAPGIEIVWLTQSQMPSHIHVASASTAPGNSATPGGHYLAAAPAGAAEYTDSGDGTFMNSGMVVPTPAPTEGHENRQPFLVLNWLIALEGVYPGAPQETTA